MNSTLNRIPLVNHKLLTIGELPASYLASMTYEEQLLWFCNYLETKLLPKMNELINTFNDTTEDLDEKFNEIVADMEQLLLDVDQKLADFMTSLEQNLVEIASSIVEREIEQGELYISLGLDYNDETEALRFYVTSETSNELVNDLSELTTPGGGE